MVSVYLFIGASDWTRTSTPFGTRLSFWLGYQLQHRCNSDISACLVTVTHVGATIQSMLVAGDRFELPMHLAYETGVVTVPYPRLFCDAEDLHLNLFFLDSYIYQRLIHSFSLVRIYIYHLNVVNGRLYTNSAVNTIIIWLREVGFEPTISRL